MSYIQVFKKLVRSFSPGRPAAWYQFEYGHDIFFDGQAPEHRRFLRKVAHPLACALIHWNIGNGFLVQEHFPRIGFNQADNHIENGCFPGSVGTQKTDDFARNHLKIHLAHNTPSTKTFDERSGAQALMALVFALRALGVAVIFH